MQIAVLPEPANRAGMRLARIGDVAHRPGRVERFVALEVDHPGLLLDQLKWQHRRASGYQTVAAAKRRCLTLAVGGLDRNWQAAHARDHWLVADQWDTRFSSGDDGSDLLNPTSAPPSY